jgi:integrase
MNAEQSFLALFEQFIKDSETGKRMKPNGEKIKAQTVDNYRYLLLLLNDFSQQCGFHLRIKNVRKLTKRQLTVEKNYWKKFYHRFTDYLAKQKNCFDNYIGMLFKNIRVFFNYLQKEKLMEVGEFHKQFYVRKEEIPVITLMPAQLQLLISDRVFEERLSVALQQTKDLFVLGCTVALRFSDLINLRFRDIEMIGGQAYLVSKSMKTASTIRVKLPDYALQIIQKNQRHNRPQSKIFQPISKSQVNKNIRQIAVQAGWTHVVGKVRKQNGKEIECYTSEEQQVYRFCDLVSSHVMRRTAITTMLMLGMPEHVVRKISGHSSGSKAFFRYVNFVQSYLDTEIDKVHQQLVQV